MEFQKRHVAKSVLPTDVRDLFADQKRNERRKTKKRKRQSRSRHARRANRKIR